MGLLTEALVSKFKQITAIERRGVLIPVASGFIEYLAPHPDLGLPLSIRFRYTNESLGRLDNLLHARVLLREYLDKNVDYKHLPKAFRKFTAYSQDSISIQIKIPPTGEGFDFEASIVGGQLDIYFSEEYFRGLSNEGYLPYLFYVSNAIKVYTESSYYYTEI